jgi:hypothetical protein
MWRNQTYPGCTHSTTPTQTDPMPTGTTNSHELPRLRARRPAVVVVTAIMTIACATGLAVALAASDDGSRLATSAAARQAAPNASRSLPPRHDRRTQGHMTYLSGNSHVSLPVRPPRS